MQNRTNRDGLNRLPWGTPGNSANQYEIKPTLHIRCCQLVKISSWIIIKVPITSQLIYFSRLFILNIDIWYCIDLNKSSVYINSYTAISYIPFYRKAKGVNRDFSLNFKVLSSFPYYLCINVSICMYIYIYKERDYFPFNIYY